MAEPDDVEWMRLAILEAARASEHSDVPVPTLPWWGIPLVTVLLLGAAWLLRRPLGLVKRR